MNSQKYLENSLKLPQQFCFNSGLLKLWLAVVFVYTFITKCFNRSWLCKRERKQTAARRVKIEELNNCRSIKASKKTEHQMTAFQENTKLEVNRLSLSFYDCNKISHPPVLCQRKSIKGSSSWQWSASSNCFTESNTKREMVHPNIKGRSALQSCLPATGSASTFPSETRSWVVWICDQLLET